MTTDLYADLVAVNGTDFHSDSIEQVGYDRINKALFVEFQSGPAVYEYGDVEESTYNLFVTAPSLNRFWRDHISAEGTSTRHDYAYINEREPDEDEDTSPQGDVKWLTTDGDTSPFALTDEFLSAVTITPSKYGVKYTMTATDSLGTVHAPSGPFEPLFEALSEGDALAQYEAARQQMERLTGWDIATKIVSVTHYFD